MLWPNDLLKAFKRSKFELTNANLEALSMIGFLGRNSSKKLDKRYRALLQEAMEAQRSGDIRRYSELSKDADDVLKKIEHIKRKRHQ